MVSTKATRSSARTAPSGHQTSPDQSNLPTEGPRKRTRSNMTPDEPLVNKTEREAHEEQCATVSLLTLASHPTQPSPPPPGGESSTTPTDVAASTMVSIHSSESVDVAATAMVSIHSSRRSSPREEMPPLAPAALAPSVPPVPITLAPEPAGAASSTTVPGFNVPLQIMPFHQSSGNGGRSTSASHTGEVLDDEDEGEEDVYNPHREHEPFNKKVKHNIAERRRTSKLNSLFDELGGLLTSRPDLFCSRGVKHSKADVLVNSINCMRNLHTRIDQLDSQVSMLMTQLNHNNSSTNPAPPVAPALTTATAPPPGPALPLPMPAAQAPQPSPTPMSLVERPPDPKPQMSMPAQQSVPAALLRQPQTAVPVQVQQQTHHQAVQIVRAPSHTQQHAQPGAAWPHHHIQAAYTQQQPQPVAVVQAAPMQMQQQQQPSMNPFSSQPQPQRRFNDPMQAALAAVQQTPGMRVAVPLPLGFVMPAQLHQQQATGAAPAAPQSPAQQQRWWGSGVRQQ